MTDITQELKDYQKLGGKNMIAILERQQQEIKEKLHIINVFTLIDYLKDISESASELSIKNISINYWKEDKKTCVSLYFKDRQYETIGEHSSPEINQLYRDAYSAVGQLKPNLELVSPNFNKIVTNYGLNHTELEEFKMSFLNDNLQKSLYFVTLNDSLPEKKENKSALKI